MEASECPNILPCGHICSNNLNDPCTSLCLEIVSSNLKCPRGHLMDLQCLTVTSSSETPCPDAQDEYVMEQCSKFCGMTLKCGHLCKGNCGQCRNGRLHAKCAEICDKVLVCGHVCKEPCNSICPPCQNSCELKCLHKSCQRKCGIICSSCKEECEVMCVHSKCTKPCDEACNREGCTFPCPKVLTCGHDCIGFCGEPCPQLCRVCDKDVVTQTFFGNEDDKNARFVVLEDCGHVFESTGIERWLKSVDDDIGLKKCPSCRKAILNTKRFKSSILRALEEVTKVKTKFFTMNTVIEEDSRLYQRLLQEFGSENQDLLNKLGHINYIPKEISDMELSLYLFRTEFLKTVSDAKVKLLEKTEFSPPLAGKLNALVKNVFEIPGFLSNQMREEIDCEVRRILIQSSVNDLKTKNQNEMVRGILSSIKGVMDPSIKFGRDSEKAVISYLKQAENYVGYLGITEEERRMIVLAMGFKQGHWYKCPIGHVYTIGECGRPSVESTCPDCKLTIGGSNHILRSDNGLSTEMGAIAIANNLY